jgi:hypothetical protein
MASGTPIPSKRECPDKSSDTICKISIRFRAGKLYYVIDTIAVMRINLFRETLFSWEHLFVLPL